MTRFRLALEHARDSIDIHPEVRRQLEAYGIGTHPEITEVLKLAIALSRMHENKKKEDLMLDEGGHLVRFVVQVFSLGVGVGRQLALFDLQEAEQDAA